jgi:hypothetical protein
MDNERLHFTIEIPLRNYSLVLKSDDERVIDAVSDWVDHDIAECYARDQVNPRKRLLIELHAKRRPRSIGRPPRRKPTGTFEDVNFYGSGDRMYLTFGDESLVRIYPDRAMARGYVSPDHLTSPWTLSHRVFYVPVLEIIRALGGCYIHAGCVCRGDECILLCGGSGHGKSTLTYALSRARYSYLSDDAVFIQNGLNSGLDMFAFPEKIKLDRNSRSHFPEFQGFTRAPGKMEIPLKQTSIRNVAVGGRPFAILFVSLNHEKGSRIAQISRSEALLRLIGQSVSITSREGIERNLDLLKRLVESSRSYDFQLGASFEGVPELIEEALGD